MKRIVNNKYLLVVNAIAIMVAFLTHFPELITLSNPYSADGLSFPGMHWADVGNEVLFTYVSLLLLFFLNEVVFHFNSDMVSIGWKKMICAFVLTWIASNLLGKFSSTCTSISTSRPLMPCFTITSIRCAIS